MLKRKIFTVLTAALLLAFVPVAFVTDVAAGHHEEIIKKIKERYAEVNELSAAFEQIAYSMALDSETVSLGMVYLKRPGKMRSEYATGERVINDGEKIWYYQPDLMQVMEIPAVKGPHTLAFDFLTGIEKIDEDFDIELAGREADGTILDLVPKVELPGVKQLTILVTDEYDIIKTIIVDKFGNQTRVTFLDIEINKELDDTLFQLDVPENTRIVRP